MPIVKTKKKLPWLAAVLNLLAPGAGYIYLGSRLRFGVMLVAAIVIVLFSPEPQLAGEITQAELDTILSDPGYQAMVIAGMLVAIAFAYDAWLDAVNLNKSIDKKTGSES